MSRLDAIRERVEAATPGPWEWVAEGPGEGNITLRTTGTEDDDHILTPHVCEACEKRGARCLAMTDERTPNVTALWTVPEAAKALRVSERTIRREVKRGKLRVKRIGRSVFVTDPELERYISADEPRRA